MAKQEIAVIGGGAKAVAIATKAACLRRTRTADVHVTIFERATIGAHWDGAHGYTDGLQPLCTPAERDLGFPYDETTFGPRVNISMQTYSWMSYAAYRNGEPDYADWVKPPKEVQPLMALVQKLAP